jgi:hypothetical protein
LEHENFLAVHRDNMALVLRVAALTASLASVKNDWEIASRVADNYKAQMENAVRIGCENITAREKSEATLASVTAKIESWKKEEAEWKNIEIDHASFRAEVERKFAEMTAQRDAALASLASVTRDRNEIRLQLSVAGTAIGDLFFEREEARDYGTKTLSSLAEIRKRMGEAERVVDMMYYRWDSGDDCYEDPREFVGHLGKACQFSDEELNAIEGVLSLREGDESPVESKPKECPECSDLGTVPTDTGHVGCPRGCGKPAADTAKPSPEK